MASIKERNGKYCVIYNYVNPKGKRKQKWETYTTKAEAKARKAEIEYKETNGTFIVPQCTCLKELLTEYVNLYGKDKWALSTYSRNCSLIENYIEPLIGDLKLSDINTRVLEVYYQKLLDTPAVPTQTPRKTENGMVGLSTIRDIHKLLRSCFEQAAKWELIERNPAVRATVPKYKPKKREIWTADILMHANEVCEDEELKLAMNLAFSGSLRIGELIGLTWDCVDISPEAVEEGRAYIYINKEYQRVSKNAIRQLNGKDILVTFPSKSKLCSTVRVLKTPKTESSIRKIYIPRTVSEMLARQKAEQDKIKEMLGSEYQDYGLVMATGYGMPMGTGSIHKRFTKLIEENNLPYQRDLQTQAQPRRHQVCPRRFRPRPGQHGNGRLLPYHRRRQKEKRRKIRRSFLRKEESQSPDDRRSKRKDHRCPRGRRFRTPHKSPQQSGDGSTTLRSRKKHARMIPKHYKEGRLKGVAKKYAFQLSLFSSLFYR